MFGILRECASGKPTTIFMATSFAVSSLKFHLKDKIQGNSIKSCDFFFYNPKCLLRIRFQVCISLPNQ